jgi:hypothetical protein
MRKITCICLIVLLASCSVQKQKGLVYFNDFESVKGWAPIWLTKKIAHSGLFSNQVDSTHIYGASFKQLFREISDNKIVKIKASLWLYLPAKAQGKLVLEVRKPNDSVKLWTCKDFTEIAPKIGQWQEAKVEFTLPDSVIKPANIICVYPWGINKSLFYVDDMRLEFVLGY